MNKLNRRNFLYSGLAGAGLFAGLAARTKLFEDDEALKAAPSPSIYGPIAPKASENTGEVFLSLPASFSYNVFSRTGAPMTDGRPTPKFHDGMGIFDTGNTWTIIRNHEISDMAGAANSVSGTAPYDNLAAGGTTTLVVDKITNLPLNEYVSLSGTIRNCAGGTTPWGTWISCEETLAGTASGFAKPHGYCFEVSPHAPNNSPIALKQMGRFNHEAVAIDKRLGVVYLTEDANPCGFYRYIPNNYGKLALGGKLQMLAVRSQPNADLRTNQTIGAPIMATWVDIADPDPASADTNTAAVAGQGFALGAAAFARLEGCFNFFGRIYFTSTNGGNAGLGQIWEYRHHKRENGILKLIFESPNSDIMDFPDNICFGIGGQMFICEDGSNGNFIRILSPDGTLSEFSKNIVSEYETSEFTGCCVSQDKKVIFVNIQNPGLTFAIWGPW